jgi:chorismate--pyruvate lyase
MLPPVPLRPWLTHQHSLTDKLKSVACDVRLEVCRHEWGDPDLWDQQTLQLSERALHREILMWAGGDTCWYARTIIPSSTYLTEELLFDRLKTQALGELIWNHPHIKRTAITPYAINKNALEYGFLTPRMHQDTHPLWARLSTLSVHEHHSFYLLEIFLPGLAAYC